jgi:hypothetical protein
MSLRPQRGGLLARDAAGRLRFVLRVFVLVWCAAHVSSVMLDASDVGEGQRRTRRAMVLASSARARRARPGAL